jgi:hypothetical protein
VTRDVDGRGATRARAARRDARGDRAIATRVGEGRRGSARVERARGRARERARATATGVMRTVTTRSRISRARRSTRVASRDIYSAR